MTEKHEPFMATHFAINAMTDAAKVKLLEWLITNDESKCDVLAHAKRYNHRCRADDCTEAPTTLAEVNDFIDRMCPACTSLLCDMHDEVTSKCANPKCHYNAYDCCPVCREGQCADCGIALCAECTEENYPESLCKPCQDELDEAKTASKKHKST